ncbi:glycosyltransferase [Poseidonibacter lekithochrous]|uniref:glycosyltransferase n=1 Tax=Poseidonibacter lekithochrous TaxID=1904463 RepID=UPI000D342AB8|nr:glycosyltransferase [Poseidonibacter lekithochrous]
MKKVLFYLHFIKIGGAEKVAIEYMQGLLENGYSVDLIIDYNMGKDENLFEYAIPSSVNFKYIKSEKVSKFTYQLRTIGKKIKLMNVFLYIFILITDFWYYHTKVKKIVSNGKYDWTISFYQFLPAYLTNEKSSKHIIWLHGSVEHFFGGITKIFKKSFGKKLNNYDYIITIADEMKEQLNQYYPNINKDKIKRIYNPFDFKSIRSKANDFSQTTEVEKKLLKDKYICTVSRLDENQKDIRTLINGYKELYDKKQINYNLYIIGDGPDQNLLEKLVFNYNLEDKILFLGKKINPYIWMKNAEIFILSSKYEGLPTVLIEVMSVDTFIISSKCKTGPREILLNEKCGDLFNIGSFDELSSKINYSINDNNYRNKKIKKASKELKRFDSQCIFKELLLLLEKE